MKLFQETFADRILGEITTFDRLIFKGHLTGFFPKGAFAAFLSRQKILLKDFSLYVQKATAQVKARAQALAAEAGRPFIYLERAVTRAAGQSKEDLAKEIAARDGVDEGLICVFSTLEPCQSFDVRGNRETCRLEVVRRRRKCLHFYFYFLDRDLGFMHVRIQSWFPFEIQVYLNGREWLARRLDRAGILYERHENAILWTKDLSRTKDLCREFAHRRWPGLLDVLARRVNPLLPLISRHNFGGYYWVLDQAEISTDIMFKSRQSLAEILPDLMDHSLLAFSPEDVMRFLGRKLTGHFQGDLVSDKKKRPQGWRIKHRCQRNSLKLYDKASVLRVETTINNPREFRTLRVISTRRGRTRRWVPMGKGVANFWRYAQVGAQSNRRYLEALAHVQAKSEAVQLLDNLCRSRTANGKHVAKLNPVSALDCALFRAALAGDHVLNGFRNHDLAARLHPAAPRSPQEAKRRCARISRLTAKLRGHGLIAKVQRSRLYRVTGKGFRTMAAALRFRMVDFPLALQKVAS